MDVSKILLDLLIVVVAAKVASEASERIGVPGVVGEILAGVLVGPSLLALVGRDDEVLRTLGEIGVILLLLDVGLEMDIGELRKVGRASLTVAVIGVAAPMALGYAALSAMGETSNTALFVGAALTATSVGITARVFGDLRALATSEARIVLGAAVADDVMGLVVLTVVVRLVTEGSVSLVSVLAIVAVAVAFLAVGAGVGLRITPPLFRGIARYSRSNGTLLALAFAFTLGFAELAGEAKLAPIVGAFLAGLALSRADQAERIRAELSSVGHLFIPVFFLGIGIDADVGAFGRVEVLRDAAILFVLAAVGKLIAAAGAAGAPGDKLTIGLGMLPRGEVGLIFATIGLKAGVLDEDLYAALLLVVLATTLVSPPLLKRRSRRLLEAARAAARRENRGPMVDPVPELVDGEVALPGPVAEGGALELALRAALLARRLPASAGLMAWFAAVPDGDGLGWSRHERGLLIDVVERGNARSWRFLESTGTLDRALPELAQAVHRRRNDVFELDADVAYRWHALERLRVLDSGDPAVQEARRLDHPTRLLLGALLVDALDAEPDPVGAARSLVARIGLEPGDRAEVVALVEDRHLLWAAARRSGAFTEETVTQLAGHLATPERARATYVLAALHDAGHERWERERLAQLHDLIQDVLGRAVPDAAEEDLVARRRSQVALLVGDDQRAVARALAAPAAYVLAAGPDQVAGELRLLDPLPGRRKVRARTFARDEERCWSVVVVGRDRSGFLAAAAGALTEAGLDVRRADLATWADGAALQRFLVSGDHPPEPVRLASQIEAAVAAPGETAPIDDLQLRFDDQASPWHTVCEIDAGERPGLLADVAAVFHAADVVVRAASVSSAEGRVYDTFELTTSTGAKLGRSQQDQIATLAAEGLRPTRRRARAGAST